ncbi:MAG TPA: hypothetical protein VMZ30_11635 [Pyrinomonadaceae bacterium]|nr:hypothetical protein [Pyrinomonadaceae bacterium]
MPLREKHLRILWPLIPALIAISFWFGVKAGGDNLLKNKTALSGIGSLERAGGVEQAQWIIQSWNQKAPDRRTQSQIEKPNFLASILSNDGRMLTEVAKRSLLFDLFFIFFYSSAMAVACLLAATEIAVRRPKRESSNLVAVGICLAYLQILTATIDMLEDLALWRMLSGATSRLWPWVAYSCSIAKYVLLAISLMYVLTAFVFWVIDHRQHQLSARRQRKRNDLQTASATNFNKG